MSKSSTAVWKDARSRAERRVPECPPDQSEPQWAYLLFTRDCSFCDKTNITRIDWEHRVRLCKKCSWYGKTGLMEREKAEETLPHVKGIDAVLDLLPYWKPSPYAFEKYYPIKAVEKLASRYAAIKAQGKQEQLEEFKEQMLARRKAILESTEGFKEWEEGLSRWSVAEDNRKMVSEKFEALGYLPMDFDHPQVMFGLYVDTRTPLTEARWAIIRPHLESFVIKAKERRIEEQRRRTIRVRRILARERLQSYFDQSPRLEAAFRPPIDEIMTKYSVFTDIIEQPDEVVVLGEHFDQAMEALPALLKEVADRKKRLLIHRMVEGGAQNVSDPPAEEHLDKVFYATTVFFSRTSKLDMPICVDSKFESRMCWWFNVAPGAVDGVFRHLTFDPKASDAVGALLRCARLESTTTVDDLDTYDLRFYCLGCEGRDRKLARSWRDCAQHAKRAKHNTDRWQLLDDETASKVRVAESLNLADGRPRFSCNRCYMAPLERLRPLNDVVEHLRSSHAFLGPLENLTARHLVWDRTIPPEPVIL